MVKETDEERDGRGRKSVIDKVRNRFLETIYGKQTAESTTPASSEPQAPKVRELDRLIEEERKANAEKK